MIQIIGKVSAIDEQGKGDIRLRIEGVFYYTTNNPLGFVFAKLDQDYRGVAILVDDKIELELRFSGVYFVKVDEGSSCKGSRYQ